MTTIKVSNCLECPFCETYDDDIVGIKVIRSCGVYIPSSVSRKQMDKLPPNCPLINGPTIVELKKEEE